MRYSDVEISKHQHEDFVIRQRIPTFWQFIVLLGMHYLILLAIYQFTDTVANFAAFTLLVLAISDGVLIWSLQRTRDLLLVTEFQNSLFGAAISVSSLFCIIARRDGTVAHADSGFRTLFPQFERNLQRSLADVMEMAHVPREEADQLYSAIVKPVPEQHVVHMRDGDGKTHKFVFSIDPLRRPQGYVLIRARNFVEQRTT